jgi:hypothetical protein
MIALLKERLDSHVPLSPEKLQQFKVSAAVVLGEARGGSAEEEVVVAEAQEGPAAEGDDEIPAHMKVRVTPS